MILVIDSNRQNARKFADSVYYLGIPTMASTPSDAPSRISRDFKAIIILSPDKISDIHSFATRLRSYASDTPIFALYSEDTVIRYTHLFDAALTNTYISLVYDRICKYCSENRLTPPGEFRLCGIDASISQRCTTYLWENIKFTRTENMLLRTLIATYPRPLPTRELLNLAFKKSRVPEPSNIRAHISIMNKKFREKTGRNLISLSPSGAGYQILTPELQEENENLIKV